MKKNTIRRALATAAALLLAFTAGGGTTLTVKADDPAATATITIHSGSNDQGEHTYYYYKIFDATKSTTDAGNTSGTATELTQPSGSVAYTITKSSKWFSTLFDDNGNVVSGQDWVTATRQGSTDTFNINATAALGTAGGVENFAKWLNAHKAENVTSDGSITSSNGVATVNNLPIGYYLITSTLGNQLVLATTNINIYEKNSYPSNEKKVLNNTTEADNTTAEIGDTLTYHINVSVPASANGPITVVDYISNGLTMNNRITATVTKATSGSDFTAPELSQGSAWTAGGTTGQYTASWSQTDQNMYSPATTGNSFTADQNGTYTKYSIVIPAELVQAIAKTASTGNNGNAKFTLEYTATLNENAVIGSEGNPNKAHIEYDNYVTPDVGPAVKTYQFKLVKQDATDRTKLNGVKFTLTRDNQYYVAPTDANNAAEARFTNTQTEVVTAGTDANNENSALGEYTFSGLKAGTYTLTETEPLPGYNKLASTIAITVAADGTITASQAGNGEWTLATGSGTATLTVNNNKGSVLPSTGGIGTTVFYIAGIVLVIGAAALLITKKKKNA